MNVVRKIDFDDWDTLVSCWYCCSELRFDVSDIELTPAGTIGLSNKWGYDQLIEETFTIECPTCSHSIHVEKHVPPILLDRMRDEFNGLLAEWADALRVIADAAEAERVQREIEEEERIERAAFNAALMDAISAPLERPEPEPEPELEPEDDEDECSDEEVGEALVFPRNRSIGRRKRGRR